MAFQFSPISEHHNVVGFKCGQHQLDSFLRNHALKNSHRHLGKTYIMTEVGSQDVIGYYTLSTSSVARDVVPLAEGDEPFPYNVIGTLLIARLALRKVHQGKGLGKLLLTSALTNCYSAAQLVGSHLVDVLSKTDAKGFYVKHGFRELLDNPLHLYLAVATLETDVTALVAPEV